MHSVESRLLKGLKTKQENHNSGGPRILYDFPFMKLQIKGLLQNRGAPL